jgi:hypothetical protein
MVLAHVYGPRHEEAKKYMKRAMMIFDEYRLKPFFANATLHLGRDYLHSEKKQKQEIV